MRRGEADRLVPGHTDGGGRGGSLPIWCGEGRGRDECFCVEDTLHRSRACQAAGEQVTLEESPCGEQGALNPQDGSLAWLGGW